MHRSRESGADVVVEIHGSFGALEDEWQALADRTGASPFLMPGWYRAWWETFGRGTLEVLAVRRDGELAAVLPVQSRHGRVATLTNWHSPESGLLALDDVAAAAAVGEAFARARASIRFQLLDADNAARAPVETHAKARAWRTVSRLVAESPFVDLRSTTWPLYEQSLQRRFRKDLRRARRRLEEQGEVTMTTHSTRQGLEAALDEAFAIEASGWKGTEGTAISSRFETLGFYTSMAVWAATLGLLRVTFLRLDGTAIAADVGLCSGGAYYSLKSGYEPRFGRFSPGMLLTHAQLEAAFAERLESFELLGTAEPYKLRFTRDCRQRLTLMAFAPSLGGTLRYHVHRSLRPLVRRARRTAYGSAAGTPSTIAGSAETIR
jgi:CelD/BcsL family acetyltransferase involved in cellulose biosynthesis